MSNYRETLMVAKNIYFFPQCHQDLIDDKSLRDSSYGRVLTSPVLQKGDHIPDVEGIFSGLGNIVNTF